MKKASIRVFLCLCSAVLAWGVIASSTVASQSKTTKSSSSTATQSTSPSTKVDLNTASEKELESLPGVGTATAKKIIAGRPYSSVDGLSKAGVSASTIKKITPLVSVSGAGAAAGNEAPAAASESRAAESNPPASASQQAAKSNAKSASVASQGAPGPGMVWVNLDSGVYHYEGSRYYGKTKNGKYMSEADAVKAGYHPAKNEKKPQ